MATVPQSAADHADKLSWYFAHAHHSVWDRFGAEQQRQMVADDLAAGKRVSLVLGALITAGLLLSILSLLVIWSQL